MQHVCNKGFWRDYYDGLKELMEKRGAEITPYDEENDEYGSDYACEIMDAYGSSKEDAYAALCYAADFALKGSRFDINKDDKTSSVDVTDNGKTIIKMVVNDGDGITEELTVEMARDVYTALKAYPEIIDYGQEENGIVSIDGDFIDNVIQYLMIIGGRAEEFFDSCADDEDY